MDDGTISKHRAPADCLESSAVACLCRYSRAAANAATFAAGDDKKKRLALVRLRMHGTWAPGQVTITITLKAIKRELVWRPRLCAQGAVGDRIS